MTIPTLISSIRRSLRRSLPLAAELALYYVMNTKFLAGAFFMGLVCWGFH